MRSLFYYQDIDFTAKIQLLDTKLTWKEVVKSMTAAKEEYDKDKAHKLFVQKLKEATTPNEKMDFGQQENGHVEDLHKKSRGPKR